MADQDSSKRSNPGCLKTLGIILILAGIIAFWSGTEESKGTEAMVRGEVYMNADVASFNENGIACRGAGSLDFIDMDTPISMTAGGSSDLETILSAGSALEREGFCQFVFFGELRDKGEYALTIGEGDKAIDVSCPIRLVPQTQGNNQPVLNVEIQITGAGAECVKPAS